jgi:predicted sulfurtransferase
MRNSFAAVGLILALMAGILFYRSAASADSIEVPRISIERVRQMLDDPDVVIIDVRTAKTWWRSPTKITNAVREELDSVEQWATKYAKDKTLIFYCS